MVNYDRLPAASIYFDGELYNAMNEDLQLAGMSKRTVHGYLRAVRQLADWAKTRPDTISESQVRRYFLFLKNEKHFAYGSIRVAFSGIKFFYTRTFKRDWETLATMKLQRAKTLPEVLTIEQVHSVIDACRVERIAVFYWTTYSMGLRLEEARNLQVGDVDAARMMVHIHRGKGAKDRYVPLPTSTPHWLRQHWATHQHPRYLFPAEGRNHKQSPVATTPIQTSTVQKAMSKIAVELKFAKRISIHTLRHSYASHLLEAGVNLKANVAVRKAFSAIMRCRTGKLGGVQWNCGGCGRVHWAGRSCGNRHCATCESEKTHQWLANQSAKLLPGVHHFMITFTVPKELRSLLRSHGRAGYEALMNASAHSIRDVAGATRVLKGCRLGFFGVLHTWGRDPLVYHPHVHYVVPGGGVVADSKGMPTGWNQTPTNFFVHHGTLIQVYKAKLADELRTSGLYDLVPADTWRKKFVVDIQPVDSGRSAIAYLAPYVHRVAISDHRIKNVDENSVTYQYKPSKSKTIQERTVSGQESAAGFAQHILPTRFRKVRYHGWMASNSKSRLEEIPMLFWMSLGWVYWLASGHAPREKAAKQPSLRCCRCGSTMRIAAIINNPIAPILINHGLAYLEQRMR